MLKKKNFPACLWLATLVLYCQLFANVHGAQETAGLWTPLCGPFDGGIKSYYGKMGVPDPSNHPEAREYGAIWTPPDGSLYLYGGGGHNDLWKFDPQSNQWTWLTGSQGVNAEPHWSEFGVFNPKNTPGARSRLDCWTGLDGKLYMGETSGFWCYDPALNQWANLHTMQLPDTSSYMNSPSPCWTGADGKLYILASQPGYPGTPYETPDTPPHADFYCYDPQTQQWTLLEPTGLPRARYSAATCTGPDGKLYLFGGIIRYYESQWVGFGPNGYGYYVSYPKLNQYSDLWCYDPTANQWTPIYYNYALEAVYGNLGEPAPENKPNQRYGSVCWLDTEGHFYMFGGGFCTISIGYSPAPDYIDTYNDLWRYDLGTNQWCWINGSNHSVNSMSVYENQEELEATTTPGGRYGATCWKAPNGQIYMFGGKSINGRDLIFLNDIWSYDASSNQWTWVQGTHPIYGPPTIYGTQDIESPSNSPGLRAKSGVWAPPDGKLYLFGGGPSETISSIYSYDDIWSFDPKSNMWTWIKGSLQSSSPPVYGTKGVADEQNTPGERSAPTCWSTNDTKLYLFGGWIYNDTWCFDPATKMWTWVAGSDQTAQPATYGTLGVSDPTNTPGYYSNGVNSWTGKDGMFYLWETIATDTDGYRGNFWKFDPSTNQWTWFHAIEFSDPAGVHGTQGVPSATNTPSRRTNSSTWVGADGTLYLFGGACVDILTQGDSSSWNARTNDLWSFDLDTCQWTWLTGSSLTEDAGSTGTLGVASPTNTPGARDAAGAWTGADGYLYLFSGSNSANDLWRYNPRTNYWTWIDGTQLQNQPETFRVLGQASPANMPASRTNMLTWQGTDGHLYLLGGYGRDRENIYTSLRGLWSYSLPTNRCRNSWVDYE